MTKTEYQIYQLVKTIVRLSHRLSPLLLLSALLFWPTAQRAQVAPGQLDPGFAAGGKLSTDFGSFAQSYEQANALAIEPDGRIVLAGVATTFTGGGFALTRYNVNGSLDSSFGTGGKVITEFGIDARQALGVALQPDRKIVVIGFVNNGGTNFDFALARYNTDGSLDASFGSGGKVTTDFSGGNDLATSVAIEPGGKIIAAGQTSPDSFALARYNTDGSLDASFGSGGKVITTFFGILEGVYDLALLPDGRIIAAGFTLTSFTGFDFALARYNADGSLDSSFGTGGKVLTNVLSNNSDQIHTVALQPDGRIVVGGGTANSLTGVSLAALARYTTDGSLDSSFGNGGLVITDFGQYDFLYDLAIERDGKVIAAVLPNNNDSIANDFALLRYLANGSLDFSFGTGGKVITDFFGNRDRIQAVAIQPDNKVVAAGVATSPSTGGDFAVARYVGGATFDTCLQDDRNGNTLQYNSATGDYQFTNCSGFTIAGTAKLKKKGSNITLEHDATDRRASVKVNTVAKKAQASIELLPQGPTFTIKDKDVTNNSCACQ
jgi:uncharacterized delta-60 repeat protein